MVNRMTAEGFSTKRVAQIAFSGLLVLTLLQLQPVDDPLVRDAGSGDSLPEASAHRLQALDVPVDRPVQVFSGSRGAGESDAEASRQNPAAD